MSSADRDETGRALVSVARYSAKTVDEEVAVNDKPTEIGIQRTSPEAPALAMLVAGCALVAAGLVGAGARLNAAIATAREGSLDPVATFFLGADGPSIGDLLLTVGLLVLIPIGIVLAWLGYRRVTDDGPAMAGVHMSSSPNGIIGRGREGLGG